MTPTVQELGRAIKQLQARHHRTLDLRLSAAGASLVQWDALRAIRKNPGASAHRLAEATFQTDQSFGALASRLVARGLIERSAGKGRALIHSLTPLGEKVLTEGSLIADEVLTRSFAPLNGAEKARLAALLARLLG